MSDLKPGRELDALVAEKVMGRFVDDDWNYGHGNGYYNYSTDIAAAWEVVEKLITYNPFWKFELTPTSSGQWYSNFADSENGQYGESAPHAICLAALKAVG